MPTFETDVAPRRKSSVRYVHTVATTTLVQLGSIIFSQTNGAPELVAKCDQLLHAGCTGLAWFVQRRPSGNPKDAVPRRIGEMSLGLWPLASSPLASLPHGDCRPGASEVAFPGSLSLPLRDSEWFYFVESARLRGASDRGFGFSFAIVVAINLPVAQVAIASVLLLAYLMAQTSLKPWKARLINRMDMLLSAGSAALLLLIRTSMQEDREKEESFVDHLGFPKLLSYFHVFGKPPGFVGAAEWP